MTTLTDTQRLYAAIYGCDADHSALCMEQGCPEHPHHDGHDHTYEQHHSPEDHVDPDGNERPDLCRCTVYVMDD